MASKNVPRLAPLPTLSKSSKAAMLTGTTSLLCALRALSEGLGRVEQNMKRTKGMRRRMGMYGLN